MFRAYDVRGVWRKEITPEFIIRLSQILSDYIKEDTIGIGKDVRIYSHIVFHFVVNNISKSKIHDYGIISTPIANIASIIDNIDVLVITASHNPPEYIGIKFLHKGAIDFSSEELKLLEQLYRSKKYENLHDKEYIYPNIINRRDIVNEYFSLIEDRINNIKPTKVVFDASNGVGFLYIDFLKKYFDLIPINHVPDGTFPAHPPDPTNPEAYKSLVDTVKSNKADFGFVIDGDGDRVGIVYKNKILKSYEIVYLVSKYYLKPGDKIVLEIMMPYIMEDLLEDFGIKVIRSLTGRAYVKDMSIKNNAKFFAEYSGHFGFKEFYYIDDGLFMFMKFIDILNENKIDIDKEKLPNIYTEMINIPIKSLSNIEDFINVLNPENIRTYSRSAEKDTIEAYELQFESGRVLIRKANTEPLYRIGIESLDKNTFESLKNRVVSFLKNI